MKSLVAGRALARAATIVVAIAAFGHVDTALADGQRGALFESAAATVATPTDAAWQRTLTLVQRCRDEVEKAAGRAPYTLAPRPETRHAGVSSRLGALHEAILVVDGSATRLTGNIRNSIVVVDGDLTLSGSIEGSIVIASGSIVSSGSASDALIIAGRGKRQSFIGHVRRSLLAGHVSITGTAEDVVVFGRLDTMVRLGRVDVKADAPVYGWLERPAEAAPTSPPPATPQTPAPPAPPAPPAAPVTPRAVPVEPDAPGEPAFFRAAGRVLASGDVEAWARLRADTNATRQRIETACGDARFPRLGDLDVLFGLPPTSQVVSHMRDVRFTGRGGPSQEAVNAVLVVDGDLVGVAGSLRNTIAIVRGDVRVSGYVEDAIIIASGTISIAGYCQDSLLVCGAGGAIALGGYGEQSVLVAPSVRAGYLEDCVVFGGVAAGVRLDDTVVRPSEAVVLPGIR